MGERLSETRLRELEELCGQELPGHTEQASIPGVTLACMHPDARDLLDKAMDEYRKFHDREPDDPVYTFAYWLFRWSGLILPISREEVQGLIADVRRGRAVERAMVTLDPEFTQLQRIERLAAEAINPCWRAVQTLELLLQDKKRDVVSQAFGALHALKAALEEADRPIPPPPSPPPTRVVKEGDRRGGRPLPIPLVGRLLRRLAQRGEVQP